MLQSDRICPLQRDNAGGVGIRIARSSHFSNVYVISGMREDGPAEQSGEILDGDILLSVNSQSVSVLSVKDVAGLICGPAGSFVRLIVARPCPQGMSDAPPSRPSPSAPPAPWPHQEYFISDLGGCRSAFITYYIYK